jgi:predicted nucleotidyltransferase
MSVSSAFDDFQRSVNASSDQVQSARERRDLFRDAFRTCADVDEVVPSGSLARGTQKRPIHDVDIIIVFSREEHPEWGVTSDSVEEALNLTQTRVNELLGGAGTVEAGRVRYTRWRNHAVKCWLDDKDEPEAFTVDAMPAVREGGELLIPEFMSSSWVRCDPEHLIALTKARHAEWNKFAGSVRMLKHWAHGLRGVEVKSLVMEVLALDYLPTGKLQPVALKEFFVKAAAHVEAQLPVEDPAGLCGPIQASLDYDGLGAALRSAAESAGAAVTAQANSETDKAVSRWGDVFGSAFPVVAAGVGAGEGTKPRTVKDNPQG